MSPDSRPRVGVGVGVLVVRDGRVLLGRRRGGHGAGHWAPPGGWLEFGESATAAAARELEEETGLAATRFARAPWAEGRFPTHAVHSVTLFVQALDATGEPVTREPDRCEGWHWVPWGAWPGPLFVPFEELVALGYRPVTP